jgi:AraC-like DNA-binding protein
MTPNQHINKDGFYELSYLVNSPQAMIEGLKKMPFVKYNSVNQSISAQTIFFNTTTYYRNVEDGLFIIHSKAKFKTNICFKYLHNKLIPSNYYCLSLRVDHYAKIINSLANGISYTDNSWLVFKPQAKVNHHHFKGTTGRYFSVYFTESWLKAYMKEISVKDKRQLNLFLKSKNDHLICPNLPENTVYNSIPLRKLLLSNEAIKKPYLNKVKKEIAGFIGFFTLKMQSENISERHFDVNNLERIKVLKAEKIIEKHLYQKFPGIDFIAQQVGLSTTKLKVCFKIVYNKTLFQYFQAMQMENAKELIVHTNMQISKIARKLGYENPSKFAAVFKAYHACLPSKIKGSTL